MSEFVRRVDDAIRALADGDIGRAGGALRSAARVEGLEDDPERMTKLLVVWARVGRASDFEELAERCSAAAGLGDQELYDAAWQLVEVGLPEVAVPVLRLLDWRHPGHPEVLSELAVALRDDGRHGQACDLLLRDPSVLEQPLLRYLLAFNALSDARVELAREHVALLPTTPDLDGPRAVLRGALGRHDLVAPISSLDRLDLRGWHYTLTGGVLLHLSPYGYDEGMAGRYAWTQDSPDRIRLGLDRAAAVLAAWDRAPEAVLALPERGDRVLAEAAGALWGLPVRTWAPGVDGLAVAYDLADQGPEVLDALEARGDQLLFVHADCWTDPPPVAPDLLTLLYQVHQAPWQERLAFDAEAGEARHEPASDEPASTWAARVAVAEDWCDVHPSDSLDALTGFASTALPCQGPRVSWRGGPVRSSRFG